jgi:hypothetical protein
MGADVDLSVLLVGHDPGAKIGADLGVLLEAVEVVSCEMHAGLQIVELAMTRSRSVEGLRADLP